MHRLPFAGLLLLLLGACVSTGGPSYYAAQSERAQPSEMARIYFVRPAVSFLMAAEPVVVVNGRRVGTLRNGEAFFRDARPGRYRIHLASAPDDVVELELAAGAQAYVRGEIAWRLLGFRLVAKQVAPETGARLVAAVPLVTGLEADLQRRDPEPADTDPRPQL